jgi:hypothetical protein
VCHPYAPSSAFACLHNLFPRQLSRFRTRFVELAVEIGVLGAPLAECFTADSRTRCHDGVR